jgi:N-acetyl-anhydromuramyl-L-alanine amidase AmpD
MKGNKMKKERKIDSIIIHCSASPNKLDIGVKEITEWHKQRGFATIGYHYVIRRNGLIEAGRPITEAGAHCFGHNKNSVGICIVGLDKFAAIQLGALQGLIVNLKTLYKIKDSAIFGHYEFDKGKTCPNLPMDKIRALFVNNSDDLLKVLKSAGKVSE